jgi:adenylate cyclase
LGIEIERKFLIVSDDWRQNAAGKHCRQGYIVNDHRRSVRVRVLGDKGYITIKGATHGITKPEYEVAISAVDATEMLDTLCTGGQIIKTRYFVDYCGFTWEIDVFEGENAGLIVAEIELETEDQKFEKPPWVGEEVSLDSRYKNVNLSRNPYCHWK